jgi:cytochrome oxidase Cu insertion factor (SCO1/SenC/PrrC family)
MISLRSKGSIIAATLVAVLFGVAAAPNPAQAQRRASGRPKAGQRAQSLPAGEYYSCPMHPDVKTEKAGRCPKCGMTLRLTRPEPHEAAATGDGAAVALAPVAAPVGAKMAIPDVELLDQDGRKVHFYSDLVQGRVVVINFIFTTCTTICPPLGATFARVQKEFGVGAGRNVRFISISVDPATDTPERLKAWGAQFHAGPAWSFVTGQKQIVNELLSALGAATASPQDHSPTVLIGNDARGQWTRTYGLARPSQLVQLINDAIAGHLDTNKQEGTQQ